MKTKFLVIVAALLCSSVALAGGTGSSSTSNSSSQSAASAQNNGNAQQTSVTFSSPASTTQSITAATTAAETVAVSGTTTQNQNIDTSGTTQLNSDVTVRNVPNVSAPALAASNDTCMGSTSAGAGFVGTGLSFGTTWTDKNCTMLKNSRELWNMGMRAAALARMCMDKLNRESLEMTGFVCPQSQKSQSK